MSPVLYKVEDIFITKDPKLGLKIGLHRECRILVVSWAQIPRTFPKLTIPLPLILLRPLLSLGGSGSNIHFLLFSNPTVTPHRILSWYFILYILVSFPPSLPCFIFFPLLFSFIWPSHYSGEQITSDRRKEKWAKLTHVLFTLISILILS